jgi:4-hydroxy-tetrahydrodipicolinate synthase
VATLGDEATALDEEAQRRFFASLLATEIDGLLVNGTTGEAPALSLAEKQQLCSWALEAVAQSYNPHRPVIAGVSGNHTQAVVQQAVALAQTGVQALLVVVPYYNKPHQRGQFEHFAAVVQAVAPLPVILYNIPGRCGVGLAPATVAQLAEAHPNIVGLKQSSPDMEQLQQLAHLCDASRFALWCGDDPLLLPMLACGATGVMSVLANSHPNLVLDALNAVFNEADWPKAQQFNRRLFPLASALFALPNPTLIKALLANAGVGQPTLRLPLLSPQTPDELVVLDHLRRLAELSPSPMMPHALVSHAVSNALKP